MVKVPSDPAQVIVNHASFRVQLGVSNRRVQSQRIARHLIAAEDTARIPVVTTVGAPGRTAARRRPVVWSGRSAPDDTGAHRLLQTMRNGSVRHADEPLTDAGATQVVPRAGDGYGYGYGYAEDPTAQTLETPVVGPQRTHGGRQPLLPPCAPSAAPTTNRRTAARATGTRTTTSRVTADRDTASRDTANRTTTATSSGTPAATGPPPARTPAAAGPGATATTRPGTPTTPAAG
ncbi:hypothetical protein SHIRM173S_08666 [Streptomyces hirsutus]